MTTPLIFQEPTTAPDAIQPDGFDPAAATEEAPYGYTVDADGTRRPKKTRGRQPRTKATPLPTGTTPSLEDLRAAGGRDRKEDVAPTVPTTGPKVPFTSKGATTAAPAEPLPPFRAGPIAKGVDKIYRRAGKLVKIWDPALGSAIIASARKVVDEEGDENTTVGEAWEEIAKVNPRIRRLLLKVVESGAWGALIAAHAPILLAIMMKESVQRKIPFGKLIHALLVDDDEDQGEQMPSALADMMGGITPVDMAMMMSAMSAMMPGMVGDMPRGMNDTRPAQEEEAA